VNDAGTNKRVTPAQILDYAKGTASTWTAKQTFNLFEAAAGTLTADTPFVISQTWNNAAVAFTGLKIDVTNTASAAGASALSVNVGGTKKLSVTPAGAVNVSLGSSAAPSYSFVGNTGYGFYFNPASGLVLCAINGDIISTRSEGLGFISSARLGWTSGSVGHGIDLMVGRDAADILAQYRGTNPQAFRIYNTYTSSTNYERAKFAWESNRFIIGTEAQTGTKRGITLDATDLILSSLPTTDPVVAGRLWLDGTALKVSAGA
jgi:hypothetical protein